MYRKVDVRMWGDAKFAALSYRAKFLWFRLLTGPETTIVPGLLVAGRLSLSEALGWEPAELDAAWREVESHGMARADWRARVIWLVNAVRYNPPASPNALSQWRAVADALPESQVRDEAIRAIAEWVAVDLGPSWSIAWEHGATQRTRIYGEVAHAVRLRDGNRCRYCGCRVDWSDRRGERGATYDHVHPRGPATPENVVVACRRCNSRKGLRTPEQAGISLIQVGSRSHLDPIQKLPGNQDQKQDQDQDQDQKQKGERERRLSPPTTPDRSKNLLLPAPTANPPKKPRATRLPPDWEPSAELVAKIRDALNVDPLRCLDAFRDWAASSPKAVKLDWDATFRSWVRREADEGKLEPLPPKQRDLGIDPNDKSPPASEASKKLLAEAMAKLTARIDEDNARLAAAMGPARKY